MADDAHSHIQIHIHTFKFTHGLMTHTWLRTHVRMVDVGSHMAENGARGPQIQMAPQFVYLCVARRASHMRNAGTRKMISACVGVWSAAPP